MKITRAFTLIELLISMAMISAVLIMIIYVSLSSVKQVARASANIRSMDTIRTVSSRISKDIMESGGISAGSNEHRLIIGDIIYEMRQRKVRRQEGSDIAYITADGEMSGLSFYFGSSKLIRIAIKPNDGGMYYLNVYARN